MDLVWIEKLIPNVLNSFACIANLKNNFEIGKYRLKHA